MFHGKAPLPLNYFPGAAVTRAAHRAGHVRSSHFLELWEETEAPGEKNPEQTRKDSGPLDVGQLLIIITWSFIK